MANDSGHSMGRCAARLSVLLLAAACIFGHARSACAVLITANGARQFYDDFEGVSPGSNPNTGRNPGHWAIQGPTLPVSDDAAPGPVQGKQYLPCTRALPGEAGWHNDLTAHLASEQGLYNVNVHAEWMMYIPSSTPATYRGTVMFGDSPQSIRTLLTFGDGANGKVEYYLPDGSTKAAALTYTPDTWQKWTMDYTVGDTQFTFSIGNGPSETVDAYTAGSVAVMKFCGNHKVGSVFYLDAVEPEPAPTVLLMTGKERGRGKGERRSD